MTKIKLPKRYNYVGVFLTYRCNFNCTYCINKYQKLESPDELSCDGWVRGLLKIETREDLPITFSGGEPTLFPEFDTLVRRLLYHGKHMDLLTNGDFDVHRFCDLTPPETFNRKSKYANIRFSFHDKSNMESLITKVSFMKEGGYSVGIWGLDSVEMFKKNLEMKKMCKSYGIDFRLKDYMSHDWSSKIYKYPGSTACLSRRNVLCKTSELLINPAGYIFRCHHDLYGNEGARGHILDKTIKFPQYLKCKNYGHCNPCDVKVKYDRFQKWGHCAVKIKFK